jgi:general secretion pathway protein D
VCASRARWPRVCGRIFGVALLLATSVSGCSLGPGGLADQLRAPDPHKGLADELRTADLSEKHPQPVKQATNPDAKDRTSRPFETFPGNDQLPAKFAKPARAASAGQGITAVSLTRGQATSEGYQLNFENASLAEVTKIILGDTLKLAYYYDPRVQGQITLSTGRPVTRDELLTILESALKMNNAALIFGDGGYRIAPLGEVAGGGEAAFSVAPEDAALPGFGVSVLPLQNVSAEAVTKLLESFIAKGGSVKAETTGNLLLIRGPSRDRQSLTEVALSFDVDWLKGQSAGIYPLTHSTPDELITELTQVMQADQGDLTAKMIRFQPITRLNAVLVLARQSSQLKQAAEWIRRLDRSSATGQSLYVYRVENGKAQDLAGLLNDTLGTGGSSRRAQRTEVAPGKDVSSLTARATQPTQPTGAMTTSALPGQQSAQLQPTLSQPSSSPLAHRPDASALSGATGAPAEGAASDIRIIADEVNNLLLIKAGPRDYDRIKGVLRQVDRPPLQVMINATIAEVTLNDSLQYGVQVFLQGKSLSGGLSNGSGPTLSVSPTLPGFNLLLGNVANPKVVLDALAAVTEVKVVSSPSVVVVDNQPALLKVGDEVPVSTQQATILENPTAPIVSSIQFRSTGVILKVIPRVNSSGLVTMDIEQEISAVANQAVQTLTPTISQRRIASTISVYSGQMVALGGLMSEEKDLGKSGLPGIARIPVLGELIGSTTHTIKRTELIVFIRPQVIRDSRDARNVAEELRSRLHSMAAPQRSR